MEYFPGAHNILIERPHFVDQSINIHGRERPTGLQLLLGASIPEAAHDSSARYPPPRCHPHTRQDYFHELNQWVSGDVRPEERIFLLKGPGGVGKSAIAQSYAEALGPKLGAAVFLSRSERRDDPNLLITSLAYQLAVKQASYGNILDHKIQRDPTLLKKSIPQQFHDLIVSPLQDLQARGEEVVECVIIIDGLDECADENAQEDIVKIIAQSVETQTTPFFWFFLTRLEPSLISIFNHPNVKHLCLQREITVSRDIDSQIKWFLTDRLSEVARRHGLALPWPSEKDIETLVELSAGLFIYANSVVLFIDQRDSYGPESQLRALLRLKGRPVDHNGNHPLSKLDAFYMLVLQRVPASILRPVQWILLATSLKMPKLVGWDLPHFLGLSEPQFQRACQVLHPVMMVDGHSIRFYHESFLDFMTDPARSKDYCIWGDPANSLRADLFRRLNKIHTRDESDRESGSESIRSIALRSPDGLDAEMRSSAYKVLATGFFKLCLLVPFDDQAASALADFDFSKLCMFGDFTLIISDAIKALDEILRKLSLKILKEFVSPVKDHGALEYIVDQTYCPSYAELASSYVLGRGDKRAYFWYCPDWDTYEVVPYPKHRIFKYALQVLTCSVPPHRR